MLFPLLNTRTLQYMASYDNVIYNRLDTRSLNKSDLEFDFQGHQTGQGKMYLCLTIFALLKMVRPICIPFRKKRLDISMTLNQGRAKLFDSFVFVFN